MARTLSYDVAVIGGGPAGMSAALSAHKEGAKVAIIERNPHLGGILRQCIHPGFGLTHFKEELTGPEFAQRYINLIEAEDIDVYTNAMVLSLDSAEVEHSDGKHSILAMSANGMIEIEAKSVVLAMGCRERTRSEIKIPGTRPAGVFTAGLAQQYINIKNLKPGSRFVILGSGDIGLIMARRLSLEGMQVEGVYELMPYANGLDRNIKNCLEDFNIPLHLSTTVSRVIGKDRVEAVEVSQVDENLNYIPGTERTIKCDGLLLSVGLIPENEISAAASIKLDGRTRGALVDENLMTSTPGVFSCGNALHVHDLADNAASEASRAGVAAATWAKVDASAKTDGLGITVEPAGMAGYMLPQSIAKAENTKVYFRVRRPMEQARVRITSGDTVLFEGKPRKYIPSIMEATPLTAKMIEAAGAGATISVSIEPVEEA